jgi:uncharacterized protein (DUF302 family)
MSYHISKIVKDDFNTAIDKVKGELAKEGFGVLTDIDIKSTFKNKLNINFNNYRILGACNPDLAYEALKAENKIGTMLPCNVIVQEHDNGEVEVSAVDPVASMMSVRNDELGDVAMAVRAKLKRVIDSL